MRDWLSAQDLASLALPGLPATERGWRDYAEREGWVAQKDKVRARQGRGGGLEFHIDLLPPATLAAYVAKHVGAVDLTAPEAAAAARDEAQRQLTLPAVESRDARLALLAAADRLARDGNMSRNLADRAFVVLYQMEKIEVAPLRAREGRRGRGQAHRILCRNDRSARPGDQRHGERRRQGGDRGLLPFLAPPAALGNLSVEFAEWRRIGLLACRFLNEPWSRVLRMPWDEIVRAVHEGQEIEDDDGAGAQIRLLNDLLAKMM